MSSPALKAVMFNSSMAAQRKKSLLQYVAVLFVSGGVISLARLISHQLIIRPP
jgi:hypothetical protein